MSDYIPLCIPNINEKEKIAVIKALDSGWISTVGPKVDEFEEKFAIQQKAKYAVACSSGTSALHIALIVSGVKQGHEVIVPNMTFIATANAVRYVGADPVFVDIEPTTLGVDVCKLKEFLSFNYQLNKTLCVNKHTGKTLKAIVPVNMLGTPVDMLSLIEVCQNYNIKIIEDAAESLGSTYHGKPTGSLSDVCCYSFNGNKIITTGGGGMITTNNEKFANKAKHLTTTAKTDPVFFNHDEMGFNYRMVNLLAAMGLAQLSKLNQFLAKKRKTNRQYAKGTENFEHATVYQEPLSCESNYWLNMVTFSDEIIEHLTLKGIIEHFNNKRIQTRPMWTLLDEMPMFADCFRDDVSCSKNIHAHSLVIPSSTSITDEEISRVISAIGSLS